MITVSADHFRKRLAIAQGHNLTVAAFTSPAVSMPSSGLFRMHADQQSGYRISETGELTHLFSLKKGRGNALVANAIKCGAKYLDCFATPKLELLYKSHGFKETNRVPNWDGKGPDVIYMSL